MAAGKTKVSGTTYNITGGKTKINGTTYNITGGRTKINGTNYAITFSKKLTITGTAGSYGMAYLNNTGLGDGTHTYTDSDTLKVYVSGSGDYAQYARVQLNGVNVTSGAGYYTISNISQYKTIDIEFKGLSSNKYYYCYITTT